MRETKERIESEITEIFKSLCFENDNGRDFYRFNQNLINPFIVKFEEYQYGVCRGHRLNFAFIDFE